MSARVTGLPAGSARGNAVLVPADPASSHGAVDDERSQADAARYSGAAPAPFTASVDDVMRTWGTG
jgi:hypothetical protein